MFIGERLTNISNLEGISNIARIYLPGYLVGEMASNQPLFGYGINSEDILNSEIASLMKSLGIPKLKYDIAGQLLKNSFLEHWIYFGFLGGTVLILIYRIQLKSANSKSKWLALAFVFIFANGISSYQDQDSGRLFFYQYFWPID